jgi:hypothetical protein
LSVGYRAAAFRRATVPTAGTVTVPGVHALSSRWHGPLWPWPCPSGHQRMEPEALGQIAGPLLFLVFQFPNSLFQYKFQGIYLKF